MNKILLLLSALTFSISASAHSIATNDIVDINNFVGKWYTHASLPQFFTKGCLYQTAEYKILSEDKVSVLNTCIKRNKIKTIRGEAVVLNKRTNSELGVKFYTWWARAFRLVGDYNIIEIDPNYEYMLVGSKNRKSLWIMSKSKEIPQQIYNEYVQIAKDLNFPTQNLIKSRF